MVLSWVTVDTRSPSRYRLRVPPRPTRVTVPKPSTWPMPLSTTGRRVSFQALPVPVLMAARKLPLLSQGLTKM